MILVKKHSKKFNYKVVNDLIDLSAVVNSNTIETAKRFNKQGKFNIEMGLCIMLLTGCVLILDKRISELENKR